jgi:hypothetical protein
MRTPRAAVALLAFSLLLAGVVVPAAGASDGSATPPNPNDASTTPSIERPNPHTIITINVTADGDARWTVTSRFVVETANETAAFESLAEAVTDGNADPGYSTATFRQAAVLAERSTGREMSIENTTWTSRMTNRTGSLSLHFTWTGFARVQNGRSVVVGDAFSSETGTWFPRLDDGQRLVINPPSEYAPIDTPSDRGPVNGSLIWNGPREFDPGYISIEYVPSRKVTPPTTTTTTIGSPTTSTSPPITTPPGGDQRSSPLFWFGVLLLVVAVGAGGYFYAVQRRENGSTPGGAAGAEPETETETGSSAGTATADDTTTEASTEEPAREPAQASRAETGGGGLDAVSPGSETETETGAGAPGEIDPELLSDEERVERLLERNGGRMKQANIVKETGWSNAKVSQLLSSMAEEDRINKLRIGRENLITLPDEDVTDF